MVPHPPLQAPDSPAAVAEYLGSMIVMDAGTGEVLYSLQPDVLSLTGSVRKLFSVGTALNAIGPDYRFETPVYRNGTVDASGKLTGDLIVKASGVGLIMVAKMKRRTIA